MAITTLNALVRCATWRRGAGVLMCAIRSAVRASGIFARVKRLFNRFPPFLISENRKRARRTRGAFVGVCQKVPSLSFSLSLSLTLDGSRFEDYDRL